MQGRCSHGWLRGQAGREEWLRGDGPAALTHGCGHLGALWNQVESWEIRLSIISVEMYIFGVKEGMVKYEGNRGKTFSVNQGCTL